MVSSARLLLFLLLISPIVGFAKSKRPSDPQALVYAAQSIAAMSGGTTVSDVTLTGNVSWNGPGAGSGKATLRALGTGESRMDLALSAGTWTEIRDAQTGMPLGQWTAPSGTSGYFAYQNCQTDAVWFFPVLGSLAAGPNVVLSYIGQETLNGESVQHIQSYIYEANPPAGVTPTLQQLSTMDFYLDSTTLLPAAIIFNAHPDDVASSNLNAEIDFSNYQSLNGAMVPTTIQETSQGAVIASITVTAASFNTGLSLSLFSIN